MPEKTKRDKDFENTAKRKVTELPVEQQENNEKDSWGADQQEKSYYYDDSYGYEIYNPEEDESNEDN
jgi:hypothetical protein